MAEELFAHFDAARASVISAPTTRRRPVRKCAHVLPIGFISSIACPNERLFDPTPRLLAYHACMMRIELLASNY
jgi:hypothetical protein